MNDLGEQAFPRTAFPFDEYADGGAGYPVESLHDIAQCGTVAENHGWHGSVAFRRAVFQRSVHGTVFGCP